MGCLSELAQKGIDPQDEESYYSTRRTMGRWTRRWQPEGWDKLEMSRYMTCCGRAVFRRTCGAGTTFVSNAQ